MKRLLEQAVAEVCDLSRRGFSFIVDAVERGGSSPDVIKVWATLHFLPSGSPFCCGESGCHLGLDGDRLELLCDLVCKTMGQRQPVALDFGDRIAVSYHEGVRFHYGAL